jgi:hypothetical protein
MAVNMLGRVGVFSCFADQVGDGNCLAGIKTPKIPKNAAFCVFCQLEAAICPKVLPLTQILITTALEDNLF